MIMPAKKEGVESLIRRVLPLSGVKLYHVQITGGQVRVLIDKEQGVTIDDCVRVSRSIERSLKEKMGDNFPFDLEVSSPGIDRPLFTEEHFRAAAGKPVRVKLFAPREGKRVYEGTLHIGSEGRIALVADKNKITLSYGEIATASLISPRTRSVNRNVR
ncbi:MAG: ribosome maturation factor RimP [Candidatus Bipolaricaulota bacterium]|nr:ribosome maturation factor RimP [Candidatus Bipolaricaulota bacterium]